MERKTYFEDPTQVMFYSPEDANVWLPGIAYKDEVICACCGGVVEIADIMDDAKEDGLETGIYPYPVWNDLSYEIYGGVLPEGLIEDDEGHFVVAPTEEENYEQMSLEDEEEVVFYNTWVDGIAMPSI